MILQEIIIAHSHSIWYNPFFFMFIAMTTTLFGFAYYFSMTMRKKNLIIGKMQQQHINKIDSLLYDHCETLERIRIDMLKREDDRTRQWIESEKETLRVLNGVSYILDMSDKLGKAESERILKKLDEIYMKVKEITINK